jgi:hypothetical protein
LCIVVVVVGHSEGLVEFSGIEYGVIVVVVCFLEAHSLAEGRTLLHLIIVLVLIFLKKGEALKTRLIQLLLLEGQLLLAVIGRLGHNSGLVASHPHWLRVFLSLLG